MAAVLLVVTMGVAVAACTGVDGRPEGAPVVVSTDAVDTSGAARSADAARDQAARASAAEQSRLAAASSASASSASSVAAASAAAEAARVAAEQQAAAEQARQQAEQEAAASAAAEAQRVAEEQAAEQAAAEQAAAEQAAAEEAAVAEEAEAQRQAAEDQAQFDAALASGTCSDAPADRVTECVGLAEDSVPPGDAGADGASSADGSGGWYDSHGNWISPDTAARAQAKGIPVGGDVPGYLRCGTLCGESPTSGEIQSEWARQQGLVDENGAPVDSGG